MKKELTGFFPGLDKPPTTSVLLEKIILPIPALVAIYNIKTGQFIFVNDAIEKILGYKKEKFLNQGVAFASSLIHPDDLIRITRQNIQAIKHANRKDFPRTQDTLPITFEYRMKHKKGSWKWLHTDGVIFGRDKNGEVEYVMNISVDITNRKTQELAAELNRQAAEKQQREYHQFQLKTMTLRNRISDSLRQEQPLEVILKQSLEALIQLLPATFARLWLVTNNHLELFTSVGNRPPSTSIKQKISIGEYAVGLVAAKRKPFVTNNIYQNNRFHIQNIAWSQRNHLQSFAGFPLFFKGKLIGVISIFSTTSLSESTLSTLSYVADIFAHEIERRKIETQLKENQDRFSAFISNSSEGIWRFELKKPVSIHLELPKQINHFYKYAYLAECNDSAARMYGFSKASEIIGAKLGDMLPKKIPTNIEYLKKFITNNYNLMATESTEVDRFGNTVFFENNLTGIIENNHLIRAWGTQRDVTEQKKAQQELYRLSNQKDEFIAIASHELKTPVTSLKAYTQVLENRFKKIGDQETASLPHRMDIQLNKLITLVNDLLDVSRIEAGKLQLDLSRFKLNDLIKEIIEEIQPTTQTHTIIQKLDQETVVMGDRNRLGQVIVNFLSNAIKYSPLASKVIIKTTTTPTEVKVSVQDLGIGISPTDQKKSFNVFLEDQLIKKPFQVWVWGFIFPDKLFLVTTDQLELKVTWVGAQTSISLYRSSGKMIKSNPMSIITDEFNRQVEKLIQEGYPQKAHLSETEFKKLLTPLKDSLLTLDLPEVELDKGTLPFVIVVKSDLVTAEKMMSQVVWNNNQGITKLYPQQAADFKPIGNLQIPSSPIYLLTDIDRGKEFLNAKPTEALITIQQQHRTPLTLEEGIAVMTHFPDFLKKNNCFSLLGSRVPGNQRVPAIWINGQKHPNLGWCWAGNPHTWLGSASAKNRFD